MAMYNLYKSTIPCITGRNLVATVYFRWRNRFEADNLQDLLDFASAAMQENNDIYMAYNLYFMSKFQSVILKSGE
jgi:hypothetical protein